MIEYVTIIIISTMVLMNFVFGMTLGVGATAVHKLFNFTDL